MKNHDEESCMNVNRPFILRTLALLTLGLLIAATTGCDIGSVDSTAAVKADDSGTIYNFSGLYMHPESSTEGSVPLVYPSDDANRPSGTLITWLRLVQSGSVLEAYDSAGQNWYGKISTVQGTTASFTLRGKTTAGSAVDVAGSMTYASNNSNMDATWIEPNYSGSLFAQATVSPVATNAPVNGLSLSANPTSVALTGTSTLTASGGTGSYIWPSSVSFGSITSSGGSATYTRTSGTSTNSATISVTSGSASRSVTIAFN